jgi:uncharacterized protein YjiS (DUF1127 family)
MTVVLTDRQLRPSMLMLQVATAMRAVASFSHNAVQTTMRGISAWLEQRRLAQAALRDFNTMGDRELLDIGLTRVDLHRVAWGESDRYRI